MGWDTLKNKMTNTVLIVTAIGAVITLISYVSPLITYVTTLNKVVTHYEEISSSLNRIESWIDEQELDRLNKKKTFSIGLRSDTEGGKIIYVDENNGIYRTFIDKKTNRYYYYNIEGEPIFCYSKEVVGSGEKHVEIRPLIVPDTVILNSVDTLLN